MSEPIDQIAAWTIPLAPLAAAFLIALFGPILKESSHRLTVTALGLSFFCALWLAVGKEAPEGAKKGFVWANWCGVTDCEQKIQDLTKATIRCLPLDRPASDGPCVHCGSEGKEKALFARAY